METLEILASLFYILRKESDILVIDFTKNFLKKRPNLILRNLDGTAIACLTHALKLTGKFCYNEVSEISFEYPAKVNGVDLPEYSLLTGMRIVDVQGYGQFLIHNPKTDKSGIVRKKECKCYSLEFELTNKSISLEEGTYNFWNPVAPESTILGIITSEVKSWGVGTVSNDLIGKYRTFSTDGKNIYDWMKSDLQETFGCIFDFDTYNRTINVRSINDIVNVKPVYLSTANLIKDIEIEENTDDLVTALNVNGADGVSIRSVNPTGTNVIYNLDAYMNENYFTSTMISKWNRWKETFNNYQQPYYQLVIAQNMQISRKVTEESVLTDLNNELTTLESQKAILIQTVAVDSSQQSKLDEVNGQIRNKESEIRQQKSLVNNIKSRIDSYTSQLRSINQTTAFSSFFTQNELILLDRYFRCGTLTESTFVATSVDSYAAETNTVRGLSVAVNITNANSVEDSSYGNEMTFYTVRGGTISISNVQLSAKIVHGTLQKNSDSTYIMSLYLEHGTYKGKSFPGGTVIISGNMSGGVSNTDTSLRFNVYSSTMYLSHEVSEYQKMSVELELYEYGRDCLKRMSSPTYYFSISSINFLALDDFELFANELELGEKIYIDVGDKVLTPIVTSVSVNFDDLSRLEIDFGDAFSLNDSTFKLEDLLKESISMGSTLDFNQYNYSNFVNSGAKTQVKDFMTSAIDTMVNRVLSGNHEQITIDQAGLRCRKYDENSGGYSPKQLWLAHNALMFTDNNWESAKIGIGEFTDKNLGSIFGIVAPAIVGTILAGTQLVIESEKTDGNVAVFKVDGEGASLHNASFNLYGATGGRIDLGSVYGIVAGADKNTLFYYNSKGQPTGVKTVNGHSIAKISDLYANDSPNANFWLDMSGNAYFKGKISAKSGDIGGYTIEEKNLHSGSGENYVAMNKDTYAFWAGAENPVNAPFWVKKNGDMYAKNGRFSGTLNAAKVQGNLTADSEGGWLLGCGIKVGGDYLNGNGNFYVDSEGNVTMKGSINLSSGKITWGNKKPMQSKFGQYNVEYSKNPDVWHFPMEDEDKYRIDSFDEGITWSSPYKYKGEDGTNGSNANVTFNSILGALKEAEDIQTTFITADKFGSPTIYGAKIYGAEIYAGGNGKHGKQVIGLTNQGIIIYDEDGHSVLTLRRDDESGSILSRAVINTSLNTLTISSPLTNFDSPVRFKDSVEFSKIDEGDREVEISFNNVNVDFSKAVKVDFSNANVIGLSATATFA